MGGAKSGGKLDTTPRAWTKLWEKLGIWFQDPSRILPRPHSVHRKENGWSIFIPHVVSTKQLVEISGACSAFRKFHDVFVCEELPGYLGKLGADILLSHRVRPKDSAGFSRVCVRALDEASEDRSLRGYSAHMAWDLISGEWYLTLREYLALWLLAKSQNKSLDIYSRTICAGSQVLRGLDLPDCTNRGDHRDVWLPAVGEDHGVLRIERVPANLRYGPYAPRRVYKLMLANYGEDYKEIFSPEPRFTHQPKLARLM